MQIFSPDTLRRSADLFLHYTTVVGVLVELSCTCTLSAPWMGDGGGAVLVENFNSQGAILPARGKMMAGMGVVMVLME